MFRTVLITALALVGANAQKPAFTGGFNLGLVKEQIGEIMIVCGENPLTCECGNGRTMSGEAFFPGIFGCNPKSCVCPNGATVEDLESIEPDNSLTREKFMSMMSVGNFMGHWSKIGDMFETFCDGSAPTSCSCKSGDEISTFQKNANKLGICRPQICKCADGSSKEVPDVMKYSFLHQMEMMCEVENCPCTKTDMSVIPPFESASQIDNCGPKSCNCKDGSVKNLPMLPSVEDNLIDTLEEYETKQSRKFYTLCGGELPQFCECKKRPETLTEFSEKKEVKDCYPTTCTCLDGSVRTAPHPKGSFNRIIENLEAKIGKEEMDKMTKFYQSKYSQFIPSGAGVFPGDNAGGSPGGNAGRFPGGFPGGNPGGFPGGFPAGGPPFGNGKIPDFVKNLQG